MIKKISSFIIVLVLAASCVSTRPANNINRAEKRIIKYNTGIQNQIKQFPSLVDKAYKTTEIITIHIPADSLKLTLLLQEIKELQSINSEFKATNTLLDTKLDSLDSYVNNVDIDLNDSRQYISTLLQRVRNLNKENQVLFEKYQQLATMVQEGTYEDDIHLVNFTFKDGLLLLDIVTKEKEIQEEVVTENYNVDIRRHFWQDIKFWGFILILINLIYFFNSLIYNFLDSIFTAIIKFVRKLLIKI